MFAGDKGRVFLWDDGQVCIFILVVVPSAYTWDKLHRMTHTQRCEALHVKTGET